MTHAASSSIGLLCPACKVDLVMTERKDVEVDYCPKCRGVWLDRGELDKIIEKSAARECDRHVPNEPQRHHDHGEQGEYGERGERAEGGYGRHYRRKSWLSDIFD